MSTIWRENFKVRTYEADLNNNVKVSSLFDYMQEAAANHAESLNYGYNALTKKNQAWILSRAVIELYGSAGFTDELVVETWAQSIDKLFAIRDFIIYDCMNKILAKASTAWLLVDTVNKRPLRLTELHHHTPPEEKTPVFNENPPKIEYNEEKNLICDKIAEYTDIDLNQHVNNVKFIEYGLDCLGRDFFEKNRLTGVKLNFLSEFKFGEKIGIYKGSINGRCIYIEGARGDNKIFKMIVDYK
ncbi:MAG: hypothetical protein JXB50_00440 [Spirochaetes bacterium]|nr:hypothetical protein [Spirochaetota bacterium]